LSEADPATRSADMSHADRLKKLRAALADAGLTGFVVPHADEHQSEYLSPSAERLAWLTGFTGSAGAAIVLADSAALFVDGRYTLQARGQTDAALFAPENLIDNPPATWLAAHAGRGDRIGYDPWLMTASEVRRYDEACKSAGAEFVAVADNPLDRAWTDRPAPPLAPVSVHADRFAGEPAAEKIARLQKGLADRDIDAAALTQADSIAWLLNIRGGDVAHNPVALAFALLPRAGKPELFIDGRKLSNSIRAAVSERADIRTPADLLPALAALGAKRANVLVDPRSAAAAIAAAVRDAGGTVVEGDDPVILPRAIKNATEIAGARRAHVRDGAAMVRFLAWLDREAASGALDEITVADRLRDFRADTAKRDGSELVDLSFDTISGAGPNGAIVHYHATPATVRALERNSLYLVDSGGQYHDGTTDITRTVAIGTPTDEMRDRFTRVLKGHIALARARVPMGTLDRQLDSLARNALWQAGLDFEHGTGHGVGSFLSVHEDPTRVSRAGRSRLEPGMIFSNEPGYYKAGEYGIRTENLLLTLPPAEIAGGDRPMLAFETLTLCPIDRRLIERDLLERAEIAWLDDYHAALPPALGHLLDADERAWLADATRPLAMA
jgi:Xaa-Pro aminopeptidase